MESNKSRQIELDKKTNYSSNSWEVGHARVTVGIMFNGAFFKKKKKFWIEEKYIQTEPHSCKLGWGNICTAIWASRSATY
jgi:hypothetical protein